MGPDDGRFGRPYAGPSDPVSQVRSLREWKRDTDELPVIDEPVWEEPAPRPRGRRLRWALLAGLPVVACAAAAAVVLSAQAGTDPTGASTPTGGGAAGATATPSPPASPTDTTAPAQVPAPGGPGGPAPAGGPDPARPGPADGVGPAPAGPR